MHHFLSLLLFLTSLVSLATEVAIKLIKENKGENEIVVLKAECLRLRQRGESYNEAVEGTYEVNIRSVEFISSFLLLSDPNY
jgi:hypothetical protein